MADDPVTVVAVEEHHEAAAADALAQAAGTAQVAAVGAVAAAEQVAAHAQGIAAEHAAQIEERTEVALSQQEQDVEWLKTQATETRAAIESHSLALQRMEEYQGTTSAALAKIAEQLTPPALPETPVETPEQIAERESADARREAEPKPVQGRKRHRSI